MDIKSKKRAMIINMIKQNVVDVTLDLINEGKNITMDEVAAGCGVSKGTIYNYFSDRQALLDYVHDEILRPFKDTDRGLFAKGDDPLAKIYEFVDMLFETPDNLEGYFHFIQKERTVAQEDSEKFEFVIKPLAAICEDGIKRGMFIETNPYMLAEMIYGVTIGTLHLTLMRDVELPCDESMKAEFIKLINRMLIKEQIDL